MTFFKYSIIVIIYISITIESKELCPLNLTVDLENGNVINGTIVKDSLTYTKDNYFYHNGKLRGCVCNLRNCIRKCCPERYTYTNKSCMIDDKEDSSKLIEIDLHNVRNFIRKKNLTDYQIVYDNYCKRGKFKLLPNEYEEDLFFIQESGHLHVPNVDHKKYVGPDGYCIDNERVNGSKLQTSVFLCVFDEVTDVINGGQRNLAIGKFFNFFS